MADRAAGLRAKIAAGRGRLLTVRGRSALLSAIVVAVAMTIGAFVLLASFRSSLRTNLDQTLQQQAQDRVTLIDQGFDPASLTDVRQEEALVWIGRPDGTVIATGGALTPLENPVPSELGTTTGIELSYEEQKAEGPETERSEFRLASALNADGSVVVLVGAETERIDKTLNPLVGLFVAAIPILVVLVALLAWRTAGRALRPVEQIRRQTKTVSGSSLSDRVPVPDGKDEIHELALTMNEMLERIEAHERSLRQFTADASHELKSPVANVRALIDTTPLDDPAWPELRSRLERETDRLRDLVDNLLYLARRADGASATPVRHLVHLDDLLFDEAELLALTSGVAVDLSRVEPASVHGDPVTLQRLVRNLADNAARHAESTVSFGCGPAHDGWARIDIHDDGAGIRPEDRERIFERFTRLDESRDRDAGGAGLGLAIVRQIADDHGGTVQIVEGRGSGTTVEVRLPSG